MRYFDVMMDHRRKFDDQERVSCYAFQKRNWRRAARVQKLTLAQWIRGTLDDAAKKELGAKYHEPEDE